MADLLQNGLAWLQGQRAAHMASPAVFRRLETDETVEIDVTASQVRYQLLDASGIPVQARVTDFIVSAAALGFEPEPGDRIEFNGRAYEVTPLGEDPCWRWTDTSHVAYRIHTRDAGELTA